MYQNGQRIASAREVSNMLAFLTAAACWTVISSSIIVVNRYIMVELGFPHPIFVSCQGQVVSGFAAYLCCRVFKIFEAKQPVGWNVFLTKIMPITFMQAMTLFCGNKVYLYLSVSFVQVLKAMTPVVTMIALFFFGLETPTARLIAAVTVVSVGTAISTYGELRLSWFGVLLMTTAEVAEALRLAMTQQMMSGLSFHPFEALMYLAPATSAWLFLGIFTLEWPTIIAKNHLAVVVQHPLKFLAASTLGFMVNAVTFLLIKLSSSLTLKLLGVIRNIGLVTFSVVFFRESFTSLQVVGYSVSLAGFGWYNHIKMQRTSGAASTKKQAPAVTTAAGLRRA